MKLITWLLLILTLLLTGCRNEKVYSLIIDTDYTDDEVHEKVLSYIERNGFSEKIIAGVKHERINVLKSHNGEVWTSRYESKTTYVTLQNVLPSKLFSIDFMLKNNTYDYSLEDRLFLDGYCELIKGFIKPGTKLEFVDYKPGKEMPVCSSLLESGLAEFRNVNNKTERGLPFKD